MAENRKAANRENKEVKHMDNKKMDKFRILGTDICVTDMEKTVAYLEANLEELKGHYVCVSNVHTTVTAYRDPEYRKIQNGAALNIPDGKPLSVVQHMAGLKQAGRVPGPDLMPRIYQISARKGYRHYFYGSTPQTLEALRERLLERYPGLQIAGMYSPPFRPLTQEEDEEIIRKINDAQPDFIWVGLGAPKQERWMAAHDGRVCGVMLGVGAGFDFHAGTVRRAPEWMQEWCLEWLFRIGQDPKRLIPRYLDTNFSFVFDLLKEKLRGRKGIDAVNRERFGADRKKRKTDRPMKIAMIGHKRIPSREGGVEIVVDELSTRLVKLGYRVDAYNRYGKHIAGKKYTQYKGKEYNGIRLITIPTFRNGKLNAIVYSVLASMRALFGHYDVIHFHAEGPCIMIWLPRLFGIRTVATIHGLDWQRSKWGKFASFILKTGEKMAAKYADELIVLSGNMQDYFMETYGRATRFIPNGISCPQIRPAEQITQKFGLEKNGYILFVARIVPEKGLHYLIEAYKKTDTDKRLVIAGGNSNSREYLESVERMAASDPRILMTGFVSGQLLEELYSNAYLFVLPSDVEGMAVSLLEAMSYGNCCLVSDIRENTEVVGEHAAVFERGNVEDLRKKLGELIKDPERRDALAEAAGEYICGKYSWDKMAEETAALY